MSNGYYFHAKFDPEIGATVIAVSSANYFNEHGVPEDCEEIEEMEELSDQFEYLMEGTYSTDLPVNEAREVLLNAGFEENKKFSEYMYEY